MFRTFIRAGEGRDNVEQDRINVEKYAKELAFLLVGTIQATGNMLEEEHLMINMVTSIHPGGEGGGTRFSTGEYWSTR